MKSRRFDRAVPLGILVAFLATGVGLPKDEPNYDEAQVPDYELPEILVFEDGGKVESAEDWQARRKEIRQLFAEHVYGKTPEAAASTRLEATVGQERDDFLGGKAILKEIALRFPGQEDGPTLNLLVVAPKSAGSDPVPAFLGLNFRGNHTVHFDPGITLSNSWMRPDKEGRVVDHRSTEKSRGTSSNRWPIEMIIDRGYALATMYYGDIDPDFDDGFENGVHAIFGKPARNEWGSIGTWAWGLSRALDYLETEGLVDGSQVAVIGHSRLGKTSLWAGAQDPRFAFVISNNSGCGGAALSRREFGERVRRINTSFPHWFNDRFPDYNLDVAALPVDQHQLIALMAPRPVYVASAVEDRWADPRGEFLAAKIGGEAWSLFEKTGIAEAEMPGVDEPVGDSVGYHVRTGKHDVTDYDWQQYLDFFDRHRGQ